MEKTIKIYIDPGHGGDSIGATYNGRKEQDDVLKLSLLIKEKLCKQKHVQVDVKLSRTTSVNPDLSSRCKEANLWGADYFLSIHRNAIAPNVATGAEIWVYSKAETDGVTYNKAKRILELICTNTGYVNRGVKKGAPSYSDYAVNRLTDMPSALIELGFIDSDKDNIIYDTKFNEMATSIAQGLMEACGEEYKEIIPGDIDGDGKVTSADARLAIRASVGSETLTPEQIEVADVNKDGKITSADAREILRQTTEVK